MKIMFFVVVGAYAGLRGGIGIDGRQLVCAQFKEIEKRIHHSKIILGECILCISLNIYIYMNIETTLPDLT